MGVTTGIGWTQATWNPWRGCTRVSPGCARCYMFREQERYGRDPSVVVRCSPSTFNSPIRWSNAPNGPRLVFTCSWSDFFHKAADAWRPEAWEIIRQTPKLTYQVLTKRPERIEGHLPPDWGTGYPNVWLGVSGETLTHALDRGLLLSHFAAKVRFLSAEPWLENGRHHSADWLALVSLFDWIIIGGESGPSCRPFDLASATALKDAAVLSDVPVFVKQLGGHPDARAHEKAVIDGRTWTEMPGQRFEEIPVL